MTTRKLITTMLGTVVMAGMMLAMAQVAFAEPDVEITAVYESDSSIEPIELSQLEADDSFSWTWNPGYTAGDRLIITEKVGGNETVTKYVYDDAPYNGSRVMGFYTDEGEALAEKYECDESAYSCDLFWKWVDGEPTVSGVDAQLVFLLKSKEYPEAPVVETNPRSVSIEPVGLADGIRYKPESDGTARVDVVRDDERTAFVIRDKVTMDNGKTYPVAHIGGADIWGSSFADGGSFMDCENIESIVIPSSIKTIKSCAFLNTPNLKKVTIPEAVTAIGDYAFGYEGYTAWGEDVTITDKIQDFVIYAKAGSEGARYAKENGFKCIDLEAQARDAKADAAYAKARAKAKYTPAKGKIVKVKSGKKMMTVKWKKAAKATGYQFRYSMDKSFKKGVRTIKTKKYIKKGLKIKKLKKKKWYVQVRAYRTVSGKTYWGKWSAAKSVKVK